MKHKIGDKVKVREDLIIDNDYNMEDGSHDTFVSEMVPYRGKIVTICGYIGGEYVIEEDCCEWHWTDEMFENEKKEG